MALQQTLKYLARITALVLTALACLGFRTYGPDHKWAVDSSRPRLWLRFCETRALADNDLPAGDPLAGATLTWNDLIDSILADFNGVPSAYIELADADRDATYASATDADVRTIDVCFTTFSDLAGGRAALKTSGSTWVGCDLKLKKDLHKSAKNFVRVVTHELGHCLGLDHPQETEHAIMSYFAGGDVVRLQIDDKMGLTYLYPADGARGKESVTFGMSCARRD